MKIVDAATAREIDLKASRDYRIDELVLMENAGRGVASIVAREIKGSNRRVAILSGKGNNGGDGFVAARHLANMGFFVKVFLLAGIGDIKGSAGRNLDIWKRMGGDIVFIKSDKDILRHEQTLRHSAVIVDAIFGTGLSSDIRGYSARLIDTVNKLGNCIVSVDVPSGIDATTGNVLGCCVRADVTATMAVPKIGVITYPGAEYSGRLEVVDIGIPRRLVEDDRIAWNMIDRPIVNSILQPRKYDCHKGSFGHICVMGGSPGKTGAAYMTAMAALRSGAGLVTLLIPESLNDIMELKTTEVMTYPLPEGRQRTLCGKSFKAIKEFLKGKSALAIGPGLGVNDETRELLATVIENSEIPLVIDADALNAIAGNLDILKSAGAPCVLTPHPGEMARLVKTDINSVQFNRVAVATNFTRSYKATLVLKGAGTVVAAEDGSVFLNTTGNPGLATAGTGDILTGVIAGLISQGYKEMDATIAAVYIHGLSGDAVAEEKGEIGMTATDMLEKIPVTISSIIN